jgi:sigma-B regulation protein RsbU (phosphoserine phosphatase)
LSIEEALTNIIYYSNPEKSKKLIICLKICLKNNTIEVRLEDNGVPFDIKSVPAPDIKSNLAGKKKGGYGIFLITRLMNFVESKRIKNQNILTMRKHLIIP